MKNIFLRNSRMRVAFLGVVLVCMAVIMALSGCVNPYELPLVTDTAPAPSEAAAQIISKMQCDAKTHTFECFTGESTYADCLAWLDILMAFDPGVRYKYNGPILTFSGELLGYPAWLTCGFNCNKKLNSLYYSVRTGPGGGSQQELLSKLCDELGDYRTSEEEMGTYYIWMRDGWRVRLLPSKNTENGFLGSLGVDATDSEYVGATPDIFHFKLGTDAGAVCRSKTPGLKPEEGRLIYYDRDVFIYTQFKPDKTGDLKLRSAEYMVILNKMGVEESLGFFEPLADSLETAVGKADSRGYVFPYVSKDENGEWPVYKGKGVSEGYNAQDVIDSGETGYHLIMEWPGISLKFQKIALTYINIKFNEDYFIAQ